MTIKALDPLQQIILHGWWCASHGCRVKNTAGCVYRRSVNYAHGFL